VEDTAGEGRDKGFDAAVEEDSREAAAVPPEEGDNAGLMVEHNAELVAVHSAESVAVHMIELVLVVGQKLQLDTPDW
jgi:hypothetical protein